MSHIEASKIARTGRKRAPANFHLASQQPRYKALPEGTLDLLLSYPPMSYIASLRLAAVLGIDTKRIRRWRARARGPAFEPRVLFGDPQPLPTWYRVSKVLAWLAGNAEDDYWQIERDWIHSRFPGQRFGSVSVSEAVPLTREETENAAAIIQGLFAIPDFRLANDLRAMPGPQPHWALMH